jgi:hypothetical protein
MKSPIIYNYYPVYIITIKSSRKDTRKNTYKCFAEKLEGKRPHGRPRRRW